MVQTPTGKGQVLLEHEQDVHRLLSLGHIEHRVLGYMEYVREARRLLIQSYVERKRNILMPYFLVPGT